MTNSDARMQIAVIGLAAKFPNAKNAGEFWDNLKSARDCISEIPRERWDHQAFFAEDGRGAGKTYSKWGGFIDGVFDFDPLFFNISPREAAAMDPQCRQFLQCVHTAIEDSGYTRHALSDAGPVSVYVGVSYHDYLQHSTNACPITTPAASIANLVSHFCDFKGPSMAVDTMCSSSLTALDMACRSIQSGVSPMAIAGAVNLIVHWNRYLLLSRNHMASRRGRCSSFSEQGDGYVPAEGVAALLLKPLQDAIRDNDNIYGVIRGTAVNHGGASIGATVPKASEQARVIRAAMNAAHVSADEISYIEAHGAGTPLGDPIEIEGLSRAFALPAEKVGVCAVGSVKSNIGHCESAAGIAGVIKVLLQLKHRQLVPSLHVAQLNSRIDFRNSPFRVQRVLEEWKAPAGADASFRRVAGVSSFGAVGTNAHVVLEEYAEQQSSSAEPGEIAPVAIVLSARSEAQLKQQIQNLYDAVGGLRDGDLVDVAYTLQVGREAMKARFACIASSVKQLSEILGRVIAGDHDIPLTFKGSKSSRKRIREIYGDDVSDDLSTQWLLEKDFNKLLKLWVHGHEVSWRLLYVHHQPRRVSLPTYPFAKEMHRVPSIQSDAYIEVEPVPEALHPLVQRNTSSLNGQRFSSVWTGDEFYLRDHVVKGHKVLPGVCYLEMARAAIERSLDPERRTAASISLRNVVWVRPLVVEDTREVHIALNMQEGGDIEFEVYSDGPAEKVLYAQGRAVLEDSAGSQIDLPMLRSRCDRSIEAARCYEVFSAGGIEYGAAYQGLTGVQAGTNLENQRFALARISLPASVTETAEEYLLHPTVMDSALQSSIGLWLRNETAPDGKSSLPFALERLDILQRTPATGYVYVREQAERSEGSGRVRKLDILVCDEDGRVCVRLLGYSTRATEKETDTGWGLLLLEPRWRAAPIAVEAKEGKPSSGQRWVLVEAKHREYAARMKSAQHVRVDVWEGGKNNESEMTDYAAWVYERVREGMRSKPKQELVLQVVIAAETASSSLRGAVSGLIKSATRENPKLRCQLIEVAESTTSESLAQILETESRAHQDQAIRYVTGERCVSTYCELPDSGEAKPWKDGGVYLITGGAGGLGMIMAKAIASEVRAARIILIGRSVLPASRQAEVDELQRDGTQIKYECVDVTDASAVRNCVSKIVAEYGALNGVVHSAGLIKDNFVIKKSVEEFREVMAPKVAGTINLDEATKGLPLECFIVFGSSSGVFGNVGQADYACANAFLDRYIEYRNDLAKRGQRQGHSLSVDWPLWAEGGMRVSDVHLRAMHREGYAELPSTEGVAALYRAYASGASQVVVLNGDLARMRKQLAVTAASKIPEKQLDSTELQNAIQKALVLEISTLLKVRVEDIDVDAQLSEFGFDSISLTELGNVLNERYGLELAPTLFFEYPSVRSLVDYLGKEHAGQLASRLAVRSVSVAAAPKVAEVSERIEALPTAKTAERRRPTQRPLSSPRLEADLVAIVGMSGCFPQADNVDEFWENLKAGKDCVTEIPKSRWDWQAVYGDPAREPSKTNVKWGAFINGVDEFDPLFFGISPREAQLMDPNQRLLMTHAWSALEDAGYSAQSIAGTKMGVFVGTAASGYKDLVAQSHVPIEAYSSTGTVSSMGPNRLSYFLNVHGPSEPIETACSSSLVAIHRAVRAIQAGDCDTALVGGIQTMVTPFGHISFSKAGMLSVDGRCKTFSAQANGYGRGEGVGMLLLKKLSDAERDNDHIYAVIRGSGENHGGRANSLTAPNPKAQAELLKSVYTEAALDPRTIGYIEVHGTGTPLGDPVEINGLKMAFHDLYARTGDGEVKAAHCGLGSVKTNIGHLELSAGIAGIIKVLLQMKHRTLIKSLHCVETNPYIQLQGSPFYLQQRNEAWQAIEDEQGVELPRRAGVSSFGFGGVNAHVVLEEYQEPEDAKPAVLDGDRPAIIVLSARNEERLRERARQLLETLENGRLGRAGLADLAYTLQIGREPMTHRLALTATTLAEVEGKLRSYINGDKSVEGLYRGDANHNKDALEVFALDEDLQGVIAKWIQQGKYGRLLDLWAKGLVFDWNQLYPGALRPRRISLPAYPFAKERYWVQPGPAPKNDSSPVITAPVAAEVLHPLLQRNTSDLSGQCFSSVLSGQEFFLKDHVVQGQKMLPAVCYLEMARAAIEKSSSRRSIAKGSIVTLKQVLWSRPIVVTEAPLSVHIALEEENGGLVYEIYSESVIHCQGRAVLKAEDITPTVDLQEWRMKCGASLEAKRCYEGLQAMGLAYGPAHRGIQELHVGKDASGRRCVLARLSLPQSVVSTEAEYVLHPSLVDSALQATWGLAFEENSSTGTARKPSVPFAVDEVQIYRRCPKHSHALIRSTVSNAQIEKADIDICDEDGHVCVRLTGFSTRVLEGWSAPTAHPKVEANVASVDEKEWQRELENTFIEDITKLLQVRSEDIDVEAELSEFGFDSISLTEFRNLLNERYGLDLAPTIFFEYTTVRKFAEHLRLEHAEKLAPRTANSTEKKTEPKTEPKAEIQPESSEWPDRIQSTLKRQRGQVNFSPPTAARGREAEPVAIIAMSGSFPQASSIQEFWENLKAGRDCITEIPEERWSLQEFYESDPKVAAQACKSYSKWGGFVGRRSNADSSLVRHAAQDFEVSPEAEAFFTVIENLLQSAALTKNDLKVKYQGNVGLYLGAMADAVSDVSLTGVSPAVLANTVSRFYNIHGPSVAIDTWCSSSLTALHFACEGLARGDCKLAVVAGVHFLKPGDYVAMSSRRMLGSHSGSRSFASGDGMIPAEGVGAVLLKPLARALADKDAVLAVIRSTSIAHSGGTNPSQEAQTKMFLDNLAKAGVDSQTISYIEAAAFGSPVDDALEVTALSRAFEPSVPPGWSCPIGSVKANIGHALGVSGMSQLLKVALQIHHRQLVPTIGDATEAHFANMPFHLQRELVAWQAKDEEVPRRAAINSFGGGGSYVNVILEDPPEQSESFNEDRDLGLHAAGAAAVERSATWIEL
jgi:polyketide synthase PksN